MADNKSVLVGSTFPLSLIRRSVLITIETFEGLKAQLKQKKIASFWGHQTTIAVANQLLRVDVRPSKDRPVIHLTPDQLPALGEAIFDECWVISPDYHGSYRPKIGEEVSVDKIAGWQVLKIKWIEK